MKNSGRVTAISIAFAALAACALNTEAPPNEPAPAQQSQQSYVCPADGYLNCMPIVPPERQAMCSGDYREWITANCPNVEIVY